MLFKDGLGGDGVGFGEFHPVFATKFNQIAQLILTIDMSNAS